MARRKKAKPEQKHVYQFSDIVFSSGWRTEDYRLAEKQRALDRRDKKAVNASAVSEIFKIFKASNIVGLAKFTDYMFEKHFDLVPDFLGNFNLFRDYIRDYSDYQKYFLEVEKQYQDRVKALDKKYEERFEQQVQDAAEIRDFLVSQRDDLIDFVHTLPVDAEAQKRLGDLYQHWQQKGYIFELLSNSDLLESAFVSAADSVGLDENDIIY